MQKFLPNRIARALSGHNYLKHPDEKLGLIAMKDPLKKVKAIDNGGRGISWWITRGEDIT